jgi:hypothetical protein
VQGCKIGKPMPGWIHNNQFGAPLDGAADVIWQIEISSSEIGPMRGCVGIVINTRRIRILGKNEDQLPEDPTKENTVGDRTLLFRGYRTLPFRLLIH